MASVEKINRLDVAKRVEGDGERSRGRRGRREGFVGPSS